MMRKAPVQDRVYLSMGDDNIFIDNCNVPQHHIEGIRFIYRQFKRKKEGIIINDPFSYGRNIQIILFLKAVRRLLQKPVLIICQPGEELDWMERFETWTDLYHEVAIEIRNPAIRSMIIINTMANLPAFCNREWGILIIDGQRDIAVYQILKLPFKADFKIWNTPINMKENLDVFSEIYKWLYPKEIFDKFNFIPSAENAVDVIEKSILLESFMEDIVIRREDLNTSFENYQREFVMPPPKMPAPPVITKKNKDATGTKIKRSKGRTDDVPKPETQPVNTNIPHTVVGPSPATSKSYNTYDDTEDYSIQNYKRKKTDDELLNEEMESQFKIIDIDAPDNSAKLYYEPDSVTERFNEINTRAFGNYLFNNQERNIIKPRRGANIPFTHIQGNLSESDDDVFVNQMNSQQYSSRANDSRRKSFDQLPSDKRESGKPSFTAVSPDGMKKSSGSSSTYVRHNKWMTELKCDSGMNLNEVHKNMDAIRMATGSTATITTKKFSDRHNTETSSGAAGRHVRHDTQVTDVRYYNKSEQNSNQLNQNKPKDSGSSSKEAKSEQVTNNLKRNNIDDKIKECEAKVSKKFKGSFLDSLF